MEVSAMTSRRDFLAATGATVWAGAAGATTAPADTSALRSGSVPAPAPVRLPDLSFSRREPFLDRERASRILAAQGLDALVVGQATNVFHATHFYPLTDRMSLRLTALAVVPRDPARPVALLIPAFSYYYLQSDDGLLPGVQPFVVTSPEGEPPAPGSRTEPRAADAKTYTIADPAEVTDRERRRRAALAAAAPYSPTMEWALQRALRDLRLTSGRIGYDASGIAPLLAAAAPDARAVDAEDAPRWLRFVRTPSEIRMMRIASQANVEAALATIREARALGSLAAIRQRFYAEAALRGNLGVFMVVDAVSSDAYDEPIRDGRAFMIDCVSHCRNFHGDYGRTVFVGEPHGRMARTTATMARAWDEVRPQLRPGLRFSEIRALGQRTLKKLGHDAPISFGPHSVGLAHNDQPRAALGGGPVDHVLEAGMILSVDVPLLETAGGGTAHLEDLVLITPNGGEPIHETGSPTYVI
jgi:Xaa-Pro aminopeptidase